VCEGLPSQPLSALFLAAVGLLTHTALSPRVGTPVVHMSLPVMTLSAQGAKPPGSAAQGLKAPSFVGVLVFLPSAQMMMHSNHYSVSRRN